VIIDNRPGAGGNIGSDSVAKSPGDGYTLLFGTVGPLAINVSLFKNIPYDPVKAFAPIAQAVTVTNLLVVHPALGIDSVKALIAAAKAKPGLMSAGTGGSGTAGHMAAELFKSMAKLDILIVHYRGTTLAIQDLIGGQTFMAFETMVSTLPYVQAGRLKALGVTTATRASAAPNIPTIAESGLPGFSGNNWYGFVAPANTPKPIIDMLNNEIVRILTLPDVKETLTTMGAEVIGSSPADFSNLIRTEVAKWAKVVKESGIQPN
jgi:tripartite-type tricarboxylate transporter receptor subunit TctC